MTDTEKATLMRRIDELCAEVEAEKQHNAKLLEAAEKWMSKAAHFEAENEQLRAEQAHWELGNCPQCPNVVSLQEALEQNDKLRSLVKGIYINYAADGVAPLGMICEYASRMKELGVEL